MKREMKREEEINDCVHSLDVRVATIETDIKWIKERIGKLESKVNYLILSVILTLIIGILIKVI